MRTEASEAQRRMWLFCDVVAVADRSAVIWRDSVPSSTEIRFELYAIVFS